MIRLARHANHYLAIFDKGRALALYHTKRLASPGQRIVLYAKDRGCSHPGCDVAGYYCEVHHVTEYAKSRVTDVNDLTLGCGGHHPIVKPVGWQTRKRKDGETEWIPPPHLDRVNRGPTCSTTPRNCCERGRRRRRSLADGAFGESPPVAGPVALTLPGWSHTQPRTGARRGTALR
ncbi:hypothetical protein I552_10098 [Mycobacterium xenopi 3993]|nr:hypothetical protein I552_10098 [Mycobacterium xenopi 3993]